MTERAPFRQILGLAVPALGVLAAEPLYLLVDTAVVGHLGAVPLGALSVGAIVLAQVSTQLTFLSYGTTARAARLHGAGRRAGAVEEGVQATWLAAVVGVLLIVVGQVLARPVAEVLAGPGPVADAAVGWLRIALFGIPFILITMAGNGWLRGVQDTAAPARLRAGGQRDLRRAVSGPGVRRGLGPRGLRGRQRRRAGHQRRPVPPRAARRARRAAAGVRRRCVPSSALGRDLVLRSLAFQACFISATAVAAHTSTAAVGAHQVVLQLWMFLALVLDSLAIAAQSLVGAALGADDDGARAAWPGRSPATAWCSASCSGVVFAALSGVLPNVFTSDASVLAEIPHAWWFFVALQPIAGVVFALDGVLLGAGDAAFLRTATLSAAAAGSCHWCGSRSRSTGASSASGPGWRCSWCCGSPRCSPGPGRRAGR